MIGTDGKSLTSMDLIRLILLKFMGLKDDHVNIYDEKWTMPNYEDLFVVVEYRNGIPIANNTYFDADNQDGPQEIHLVNKLEKIVVGVFSRNGEAEFRKDEVPMALVSQYAQFLQEAFAFKISRIAPDEDLSALEGASMLKRYDFDVSVYAWYKKAIKADYMVLPSDILVTANDVGSGIIQQKVSKLSKLPSK